MEWNTDEFSSIDERAIRPSASILDKYRFCCNLFVEQKKLEGGALAERDPFFSRDLEWSTSSCPTANLFSSNNDSPETTPMIEFDMEKISGCNGEDGKPVYIVHQGKVYDVSASKLWKGGIHMRRHHAGNDLTTDISAAPHGLEVLERYPQVGTVKEGAPEQPMPEFLSRLLSRYPMLRRHPHPMTVHFPIVFMLATTLFNIIYLMTGIKSFETTAVHCLGAGLLMTPVVILAGLYTWWLNYLARPLRAVNFKIVASLILFVTALFAFTWRVADPHILDCFRAESFIYFLLILSFAPLVSVIGWFGAQLTFPVERG